MTIATSTWIIILFVILIIILSLWNIVLQRGISDLKEELKSIKSIPVMDNTLYSSKMLYYFRFKRKQRVQRVIDVIGGTCGTGRICDSEEAEFSYTSSIRLDELLDTLLEYLNLELQPLEKSKKTCQLVKRREEE